MDFFFNCMLRPFASFMVLFVLNWWLKVTQKHNRVSCPFVPRNLSVYFSDWFFLIRLTLRSCSADLFQPQLLDKTKTTVTTAHWMMMMTLTVMMNGSGLITLMRFGAFSVSVKASAVCLSPCLSCLQSSRAVSPVSCLCSTVVHLWPKPGYFASMPIWNMNDC